MKRKLLACMMMISVFLGGCGADGTAGIEETSAVAESTQSEVSGTASVASDTTAEESSRDGEAVPEELTIADISSMELVSGMKIGWNLGNTLDASGGLGVSSEFSWGNPRTTQEMIDAVLDQGFNVIRIPVTWSGHIWGADGYRIQEEWLDRVQEVVDYAYDRGAYVILNTHHEDYLYPSEEQKEAGAEELAAVWTQIAIRFRDYDERLIFEGMNEPRKIGTSVEWTGGDTEGQEVVNYYAQVFVDAVRATGGNNTLRHLMIPGYAASSSSTALRAIVLPDDDKLIVSVHAYIPYNFALNTAGTATWNEDTKDIDTLMGLLDELFISQGVPVIIGEFGAMNKENEAERVEWATYYVTKAKEIGVPCVWWDNNTFTGEGENFGLLDRTTLEFPYPDLLNALMQAAEK
ncbi:MAG: glycoside hydrolase family 5 protein [Lachnospiraceae bacterium]